MARPRQFDEQQALERALDAFWARGYEATSVTDLMSATGLAKASLYSSLGDKHTVFLRALELFMRNGRRDLEAIAAQDGVAADLLRQWLEHVAAMATCSGVRRGCFMVNSAVELAPHDADVQKLLRRNEKQIEALYTGLLERGVRDGSLRSDLDIASAAGWLTTAVYGMQVKGKLALSPKQAGTAIDFTLSALATR